MYMGTRGFCDCIDRSYEYFLDIECKKGKNGEHKSENCYHAGGSPPIIQSNLEGTKICGKRAGASFKNVVRPSLDTKKCPENYEPCYPQSEF